MCRKKLPGAAFQTSTRKLALIWTIQGVCTHGGMVLGEILLPEDFVQGHKEKVFAMDICDK